MGLELSAHTAPSMSCAMSKKTDWIKGNSQMKTTMTEPGEPLPVRRLELVSWASGKSGQYLVRNRSTRETFQLGCEEQFLLEQLDGGHTAAQLGAAFWSRTGTGARKLRPSARPEGIRGRRSGALTRRPPGRSTRSLAEP